MRIGFNFSTILWIFIILWFLFGTEPSVMATVQNYVVTTLEEMTPARENE